MSKVTSFRFREKFISMIESESRVRDLSRNELIVNAVNHFLTCKKAEKQPSLREIINAFQHIYCTECRQDIPIGQPVLWGRTEKGRTIYLCLGCQVKGSGDKALIRKDQKRRSLERLIKAYHNQIDQLSQKFAESEFLNQHQKILEELRAEHKFFMQFSTDWHLLNDKDLNQSIEDILLQLRAYMKYVQDFETFYEKTIKKKATKVIRR